MSKTAQADGIYATTLYQLNWDTYTKGPTKPYNLPGKHQGNLSPR